MRKITGLCVAATFGASMISAQPALADCAAYDGLDGDAKKATFESFFDVFTELSIASFSGTTEIAGAENAGTAQDVANLLGRNSSLSIADIETDSPRKLKQACRQKQQFDKARIVLSDPSANACRKDITIELIDITVSECSFGRGMAAKGGGEVAMEEMTLVYKSFELPALP